MFQKKAFGPDHHPAAYIFTYDLHVHSALVDLDSSSCPGVSSRPLPAHPNTKHRVKTHETCAHKWTKVINGCENICPSRETVYFSVEPTHQPPQFSNQEKSNKSTVSETEAEHKNLSVGKYCQANVYLHINTGYHHFI